MLDDAVARPLVLGLVEAPLPAADTPPRHALPRGLAPPDLGLAASPRAPDQDTIVWRLDDGQPGLHGNFPAGPEEGYANRFDPIDFYDTEGRSPSAVTIHRIHFYVSESTTSPEPTGPMEWHIWEDNGGHKADVDRDIVPPLTVDAGPGENVIDLDALGVTTVIDPPRLFHVGVANKVSEAATPDIDLDDGLPYVGDSGDFHASVSYNDDFCGRQWGVLATEVGGETRSPVFLIWLEVTLAPAPGPALFEAVDAEGFTSNNRNAWGDYDGDGREDLLARGGVLYQNNGDGTFTDVTQAAGITDSGAGALWADYDNDGDLDFFQYTNRCVPCETPQEDNYDDLWRNNGDGTFTNVRDEVYGGDPDAPVPRDPLPTEAAAWGDFNGDGYLDLYTANHVDWVAGTCYPDYLWLNSGPPDYAFRDVSEAAGVRAAVLCGRGVNPGDFDADGDLDIFVSNYRLNRDLLWVNTGTDDQGVPQFVNEAGIRGVQGTTRFGRYGGSYGHTISSAWGDLDRDGDMDLVASRLAHSAWLCFSDPTMIYESSGRSGGFTFQDRRVKAGVDYTETHSDASLADMDNDGFLDLHITQVYDGWRASTYRNTGERP
ncbi:MAG: FG-GAP repeat domain-containing protein, partial [Anaerolineae bacterium]